MFKLIKWELIDFFKKNYKFAAFLGILLLLIIVFINEYTYNGSLAAFLLLPLYFTIFYLLIAMFYRGTKVIVDTYKNKTFLLESMVAYSPAKLLLAKYLLAIILNVIHALLLALSLCIIAVKFGGFEALKGFSSIFNYTDISYLIKYVLQLLVSSINFTAVIVMVYILTKSLYPNKRGSLIVGIIIWWVITYLQGRITLSATNYGVSLLDNGVYWVSMLINLALSVGYYFISVKLIRDKLEIY